VPALRRAVLPVTEPAIDHGDVVIRHGDAVAELAAFEAASAQCVVTSPPFWGLRDYGGGELEIGQEPTPEAWTAAIVAVMRACRRVLRPDGVAWLEVGDSYAATTRGAGGAGKQHTNAGSVIDDRAWTIPPGVKPKDLVGAPWMLAFALRADGWWLRSDTIWHRPNPMPESCTDRPTKAHSYVFLLSASERYYYDAAAIAELAKPDSAARADRASRYDDPAERALVPYAAPRPTMSKRRTVRDGVDVRGGNQGAGELTWGDTANARSVWTIPTEGTTFSHFATMPTALAAKCILAGSRPGDVVLDPFMGSGTTAVVARELGRRAIGTELSADYLAIARDRLAQLGLPLEAWT
jgi:DNA modification methylase